MANPELLNAYNDCIDRLARGQSIQDCLSAYPMFAKTLRPMLETGLRLKQAQARPFQVQPARDAVMMRLVAHQQKRRRQAHVQRVVAGIAAALLFSLGGVVAYAQDSLPGNPLYGVKRLTENVQVVFGGAPLQKEYEQRRISEIAQLMDLKRAAPVTFEGIVEAAVDGQWRIASLNITVPPAIVGAQSIQIGDRVEVQGRTTIQGELIAASIHRLSSKLSTAEATVSPTPTVTTTATSTDTVTPAETVPPTATATLTWTVTPSATETAPAIRTELGTPGSISTSTAAVAPTSALNTVATSTPALTQIPPAASMRATQPRPLGTPTNPPLKNSPLPHIPQNTALPQPSTAQGGSHPQGPAPQPPQNNAPPSGGSGPSGGGMPPGDSR